MSDSQSRSPRSPLVPTRPPGPTGGRWCAVRRAAALVGVLAATTLGVAASTAGAATTTMVDLGAASSYAVISGASVGNTVSAPGAPHTTLRGDLAVKASTEPTGFPPGVLTGTKHVGDAAAVAAHNALVAAYAEVAARPDGAPLAGALAGATITPGLYAIAGAVSNTTTVTLDAGGDPDAVFVFQVNGAMAMAAGSRVVLTGGARASRVFWQVNGAGAVGANASFAGTLMALDAVAIGNGTVVNGRAFARNGALTLDANEVYSAEPVVTIDGGASASTADPSPTITGTTDVTGTDAVTVTVGGATLKATPTGGRWSVSSGLLANDVYAVVASVTDGAENVGRATQSLTVDTVPPVVTLTGGDAVLTGDATPTIAGTTDVAVGSVVDVTVSGQALRAIVHGGGTWNVAPQALADGTHAVTAAVRDPAGNAGTARQDLTVDTTAPSLVVAGGATALTNDATPTISGTSDVAPGATVSVDLADETLGAEVQSDGSWSVVAPGQTEGPHRVVVGVTDAAGNRSGAVQRLTVDTIAPQIAIVGGATASTDDVTPTVRGTSDAAAGSTVTVTIGGRTVLALVQSDGTWNATPSALGLGTHAVAATVADPATNVGRAEQALTITGPTPPPGTGGGTPPGTTVAPPGSEATPPAAGGGSPVAPGAAPSAPTPATPPTTTATPPPAQAPATVAAAATVARSGSLRVRGRALSIGTKVTAPKRGRVVVTVKGTVRIAGVAKALRLSSSRAQLAAGRSTTLRIRAAGGASARAAAFRQIEAAARKGRTVTATLIVTVTDAAGHTRRTTRTVRLTA